MNSDETRRRLLDERARNPADFTGMSARPESLADSVGFQPIRARVGELQSEQFRQTNSNSCKPRPFIGSGPTIVLAYNISFRGGGGFVDGSTHTTTLWIGYLNTTGTIINGSTTIGGVFAADPPVIGDLVSGTLAETGKGDIANTSTTISNVSGTPGVGDTITGTGIPGATTITSYDATLHTMVISNAATATASGVAFAFSGSVAGTVTSYNAGTGDVGITAAAVGTGLVTLRFSNLTSPNHPFPAAKNGKWQFGLNMFAGVSMVGELASGGPPPPPDSGTGTCVIQILDASSTVLSTATGVATGTQTAGFIITVSFGSLTVGAEEITQFYGVKFTITGGDVNLLFTMNGTLYVIDPDTLVADQ